MKNLLEKLRVEDWVAVWVSVPLLLLSALVPAVCLPFPRRSWAAWRGTTSPCCF